MQEQVNNITKDQKLLRVVILSALLGWVFVCILTMIDLAVPTIWLVFDMHITGSQMSNWDSNWGSITLLVAISAFVSQIVWLVLYKRLSNQGKLNGYVSPFGRTVTYWFGTVLITTGLSGLGWVLYATRLASEAVSFVDFLLLFTIAAIAMIGVGIFCLYLGSHLQKRAEQLQPK